MIDITNLQKYYQTDQVFASQHAAERFRERGIRMRDIKAALFNGRIIEQYEEDFPFPSCLICGTAFDGKPLHVVMSDEGSTSRIITAYYPDSGRWDKSYTVRKKG